LYAYTYRYINEYLMGGTSMAWSLSLALAIAATWVGVAQLARQVRFVGSRPRASRGSRDRRGGSCSLQ
jgi:hypothetical protein